MRRVSAGLVAAIVAIGLLAAPSATAQADARPHVLADSPAPAPDDLSTSVAATDEATSRLSVDEVSFRTNRETPLPLGLVVSAATVLWLGSIAVVVVLRRRNG